jgi:hypothetical protein
MSFRTTSQNRIGQSTTITSETLASVRGISGPAITNVIVTDSNFNNLDDTAVGTSNSFIKIIGTGFSANANVYIGGTLSSSANVTFVNSTQLNVTLPNLTSATNNTVSLFNTNGSGAIYASPILASGFPSFTTSSYSSDDGSISVQLLATGVAPLNYRLKSGSSLPAGLTLSSTGLISGTYSGDSTTTFTVLVDDAYLQTFQQDITLTIVGGDAYYSYVSLLLNGDGTNGAQNNTFLDSSSNAFTITRNGNTIQGSFSPYGNLWSNNFNGSNSYLSLPNNSAFAYGTSPFTVEAWFYCTNVSVSEGPIYKQHDGTSTGDTVEIRIASGTVVGYIENNSVTSASISNNTWYHVAWVRNGSGVCTLYLNGVSQGNVTDTVNITTTPTSIVIGTNQIASGFFPGYVSNLRITNTAVYTSNFTPSTTPLTAISGTQLLTCQSNRFIDNSSNAFAITVNGSPSVQRFSPFNPTAPYSTATIGGSGYFDGSTSYLTTTASSLNFGSNNLSVEMWIYPTNLSNNPLLMYAGNGNLAVQLVGTNGTIELGNWANAGIADSTGKVIANSWNHVVGTRSGNSWRIFINGNLQAYVSSYSFSPNNTNLNVGYGYASDYFTGYIADYRVYNGSIPSAYTTSATSVGTQVFTPPSAPLTNDGTNALLFSYQNAGIPDLAMQNDLQTVGSAQVSTSVKKYGTGSIDLTASGSCIYFPVGQNSSFNFGSGDFTIEFWVYMTHDTGGYQRLIFGSDGGGYQLVFDNGTNTVLYAYTGAGNLTTNKYKNDFIGSWNHFALCRVGNTLTSYFNGVSTGSTTVSGNINIGSSQNQFSISQTDYNAYAYFDDFRITKGYSRYAANFTPPTGTFKTK